MAEMTPALSLDPDEALAGVPDLFGPCDTPEEAARRVHIGEFALTAIDTSRSHQDREDALRHLIACDPVRAMGALIELAAGAQSAVENIIGDPPGTAVALLHMDIDGHAQGLSEAEIQGRLLEVLAARR